MKFTGQPWEAQTLKQPSFTELDLDDALYQRKHMYCDDGDILEIIVFSATKEAN